MAGTRYMSVVRADTVVRGVGGPVHEEGCVPLDASSGGVGGLGDEMGRDGTGQNRVWYG